MSQKPQDRRTYIRLDTVFPVQFVFLTPDTKERVSDTYQGFTRNVSKGGICLEINNLDPKFTSLVTSKRFALSLNIELPVMKNTVKAFAHPVWVEASADNPQKFTVGANYDQIDEQENSGIMRYAWGKKLFLPAVLTMIFLLGAFFIFNSYVNINLTRGNKLLVDQLIRILQESNIAKQKIKTFSKQKVDLESKIQSLQLSIKTLEEEKSALQAQELKKGEEVRQRLQELTKEKMALEEQLIGVQKTEDKVTDELLSLTQRKTVLARANLEKMYKWLKIHQNNSSGLVMSYEGDEDISNWSFTYDQALSIIAFSFFSDFDRAKKTLEFFRNTAKTRDSLFYNAYYFNDGAPAEYVLHSGPNIWMGIAIAQYTQASKDNSYLALAEQIASSIVSFEDNREDIGVSGGPESSWYSTEHNLDAYALFKALHQLTGKDKYLLAKEKILNWLVTHAYDRQDASIKRGKGDSTIATDTYAWSIAAIGPEKLQVLGMKPDLIMEFAEQNCSVEVDYQSPNGETVKITGFDFAGKRNLARGPVISAEWTAQMILSYKIMSDFYYKKGMIAKARLYDRKVDQYLSGLSSMIISSASSSGQGESCLPYASEECADTGHGWVTPKGKSTGSVAATVYTLFAYYNFNPLELAPAITE